MNRMTKRISALLGLALAVVLMMLWMTPVVWAKTAKEEDEEFCTNFGGMFIVEQDGSYECDFPESTLTDFVCTGDEYNFCILCPKGGDCTVYSQRGRPGAPTIPFSRLTPQQRAQAHQLTVKRQRSKKQRGYKFQQKPGAPQAPATSGTLQPGTERATSQPQQPGKSKSTPSGSNPTTLPLTTEPAKQ